MVSDEPFEQWVRRREEEQQRKVGRLRLNTLASGTERGSHVDPDEPRLISRWDGYAWEPVSVARNWESARFCLFGQRRVQMRMPARWRAAW
ncbi:DUF6087 family protein [Streptomyces griseofuscus]|uniref:DUF6087 family protein n=1 Tax=Streptomyces griseofuscus TaxID=146922 RepID=UPI003427AE7A